MTQPLNLKCYLLVSSLAFLNLFFQTQRVRGYPEWATVFGKAVYPLKLAYVATASLQEL